MQTPSNRHPYPEFMPIKGSMSYLKNHHLSIFYKIMKQTTRFAQLKLNDKEMMMTHDDCFARQNHSLDCGG